MLIHKAKPLNLSDVVGQKHIVNELQRRFTIKTASDGNGKMKTDYNIADFTLLEGPTGTGKNSVANIITKLLLCKSPVQKTDGHYEPCNKCSSCTAINNNAMQNQFFYYDGSQLKKEHVGKIAETLTTRKHFSENNVVVIDEAQNIVSSSLRSSFLTITDVPLRFGYLLLCTSESEIFNKALLSRFNRLNFNKISSNDISSKLIEIMQNNKITPPREHHQEFTSRTLPFIAKASNGSLREAIGLLEKCSVCGSWTIGEFKEVSGL